MAHNPQKFAANISAKLATRSRHVCTFLGAGVSKACGLPDVANLQKRVLAKLDESNRALFSTQLTQRNLEQALSRVRRIAALLKDSLPAKTPSVPPNGQTTPQETIEGLSASSADKLDELVCKAIVEELSVANTNLTPMRDFAAWAGRCDYHSPLEIYTVNYDLLLETALEDQHVAYFDGFLGTLTARFRTELVEPMPGADCMPSFFTRLWKLHGSLNWAWDEKHKILRRGTAVEESAAIYPSDTKYDESRRMPFVVLQDRFRRALLHPETLTLISGYSFGDEHLNEMIYEAASTKERSEIVVFCHSKIPHSLAEQARRTPNIQIATKTEAIISGVRADWQPPMENEYPVGIWKDGAFTLGDFAHMAAYLAKSVTLDVENRLLVKLAELVAAPTDVETKVTHD
jgi:NAD-dependent SIR2 family protein deacetylase